MEAQAVEFHVAVRAVDHSIISGRDLGQSFQEERTSNSDTMLFVPIMALRLYFSVDSTHAYSRSVHFILQFPCSFPSFVAASGSATNSTLV
jgi:hypothetical protein